MTIAETLRTGTTTIPCGEQEGGVLHYGIAHLRGKGSLTIKLEITGIRFEAWDEVTIKAVNNRYRPWPSGTLACPSGSYSPTAVTSGTNWISTPVMVN